MNTSKLYVDQERSEIRVDFDISNGNNEMYVRNELGEKMKFHLSHMIWKQPSEHYLDKKIYSAELQVFHIQYATTNMAALTFLFDKELSIG